MRDATKVPSRTGTLWFTVGVLTGVLTTKPLGGPQSVISADNNYIVKTFATNTGGINVNMLLLCVIN